MQEADFRGRNLHLRRGNDQSQKSIGASSAPVLFSSLLLPQLEPALLSFLAPSPAGFAARRFARLPLQLQGLLGSCADTGAFGLPFRLALHPFRIRRFLFRGGGNRWTEPELIVVRQKKRKTSISRGSAPNVTLHAQSCPPSTRSNTPTQKGSSKYTVSHAQLSSMANPPFEEMHRNGQPGGAGYLPESQDPDGWATNQLWHAGRRALRFYPVVYRSRIAARDSR